MGIKGFFARKILNQSDSYRYYKDQLEHLQKRLKKLEKDNQKLKALSLKILNTNKDRSPELVHDHILQLHDRSPLIHFENGLDIIIGKHRAQLGQTRTDAHLRIILNEIVERKLILIKAHENSRKMRRNIVLRDNDTVKGTAQPQKRSGGTENDF